ncbi:MAG: efflux RND transporter periplasmic adaptor subunit [Luteolibacter sp.]
MKTFLTIIITALLVGFGSWFFLKGDSESSASTEKKPLYYQSAMHPWIKSDEPGRCTICGMELTPVYPGDKGFDESGGEDIVALSDSQIRVLNVATEEVAVRELGQTVQVAGTIDDNASTHRIISAYVDARVDKLFANYMGAPVVEGEPLIKIYSPALLQAEREYRRLSGDLKNAAALRLKQMGLTDAQIREVATKPDDALHSMILAPLTGTVVTRNVYEGQYVKEGEAMLEIGDFSTMWFLFDAYEQDLPFIKVGQNIDVTLPSQPGKIFPGTVSFIDPNFNETTRTTEIRVDLPNPEIDGRRELFHKVYAEGLLKLDSPPVLTVPRSAVIQTSPQAVVYVDEGGGAYRQAPVKLGRRGNDYIEVLSGVTAGEQVVTNGTLLIDGQAEMNRSYSAPAPEKTPTGIELTEAQTAAIQAFLETANSMSAALAADDLAAFDKASEPAMMKTGSLIEALASTSIPKEQLDALDGSRHFHGFDDLATARAAYLEFSMAAVSVLQEIKVPEARIFECPMVDQAVPDAEKKGRWIQTGDREIANPYFGSEMLSCGKEIQP